MKLMLAQRHWPGRLLRLSLAVVLFCTVDGRALGAAPIKVVCIGEHTTHSHAFPAMNRETQPVGMQEYPAMLQTRLGAAYDVRNFGDCCATVTQGYSTVGQETHPYVQGANAGDGPGYNESIALLPDIVVIGSWGRHDWGLSKASTEVWNLTKFQQDYDNLVQRYMSLSTHPKVFASLPVPILFGQDGPDNGVLTSSVVTVIKAVAAKYNLPIVDLYAPFFNHRELYKQPPDLEGEGEHVTDVGLSIIADKVYAAMIADIADAGAEGGPTQADASLDASAADAGAGSGGTTGIAGAAGAAGDPSAGAGGLAGSASTGSSATGSGTGGATGAATTGGQGGSAPNMAAPSSGGCSCRSSARTTPWSAALGALGGLAILRRRFRRRSRVSP
jgi:MYXO-CTERM domain-containing protein